MSKITFVTETTTMRDGKIIGVDYYVRYDEGFHKTYRHPHYTIIPMTVLNFILDESVETETRYQEFDGNIIKRTRYINPV